MVSQDLVIDQDVRNWVLIPLTLSVFLLMLLRQYASVVSRLFISMHALVAFLSPFLSLFYYNFAANDGWQVWRARQSR